MQKVEKIIPKKVKQPKSKTRFFRWRLFHKILAVVILVSFCSIIGTVSALIFSRAHLTENLNNKLNAAFNEIFSNVSDIFNQMDNLAQANIRKASGLVALENIWKVFQDGQSKYITAVNSYVSEAMNREIETPSIEQVYVRYEAVLLDIEKELADYSDKPLPKDVLSSLIRKKKNELQDIHDALGKKNILTLTDADKSTALDTELAAKFKDLQQQTDRAVVAKVKDEMRGILGKMGGADMVISDSGEEFLRQIESIRRKAQGAVKKSLEEAYLREAVILIIVTVLLLFVSISVAVIVTRSIVKPGSSMIKALQIMTQDGDLTKEIKVQSSDEIGDIGETINIFCRQLRVIIGKILSNSERVSSAAQQFSEASHQTNVSIVQISNTIQDISHGAVEQLVQLRSVEKIFNELRDNLKVAASNAEIASTSSIESAEYAEKGRLSLSKLKETMNKIVESSGRSSSAIKELKESSAEIGDIVTVITSFTDQTNLLSLNAAIEAARAGESGRGFAVVAEEVRKLADGSANAANQISQLVRKIIPEIDVVVELAGKERKEAENGMLIVEDSFSVQETILKSASRAKESVIQIANTATEQLKITEKTIVSIKDVSNVAEHNAAATEELSSSTAQMTASMEELSIGAAGLTKDSAELKGTVVCFKIGDVSSLDNPDNSVHEK